MSKCLVRKKNIHGTIHKASRCTGVHCRRTEESACSERDGVMKRMLKQDAVLVLVDFQEKLLAAMRDPCGLKSQVVKLIRGCQILGVPVLCTEQVPEKLGSTVPEAASLLQNTVILSKSSFSCVREPAFLYQLDQVGRSQVLLAGVESHVCILQTALDLAMEDYDVCVVEDAVSSRRELDHGVALRALAQSGISLGSVEMVLFQFLGTAEDPAFRDIHQLVR